MRVQHNITAMNAYRNYSANTSALAKNLEKLSSGYKINRAGDDAAGLAISEKMRAQITGLDQAQSNAKDGISLIQTAEGALTEVHDMLNRMYELAEQSANGTYDNDVDRAQLQKELDQLRTEINRIADSSNFNGINLLDGSMSGAAEVAKYKNVDLTAVLDATAEKESANGEYELDLTGAVWSASATATTKGTVELSFGELTIKVTASEKGADITGEQIAAGIAAAFTDSGAKATTNTTLDDGTKVSVSGGTVATIDGVKYLTLDGKALTATVDGGKITFTGVDSTELNNSTAMTLSADSSTNIATNPNGSTTDGNQLWSQAWTTIEEAVNASSTLYAQSQFTLGTDVTITDGTTIKIGDEEYTFAVGADSGYTDADNVIDLTDMESDSIDYAVAAYRLSGIANGNSGVWVEADNKTGIVYLTEKPGGIDRSEYDLYGEAYDGSTEATKYDATWKNSDKKSFVQFGQAAITGSKLTLQIGDTAEDFNQLKVSIKDCHAAAMGIGDVDISTQEGAASALTVIKNAINYVSDVRGTLGATQNRLDHTINNLSVMQENIQDAESTIRDTDIAEEMMEYTKNSILVQSAQAMLAQANQLPQGVLQLLQ